MEIGIKMGVLKKDRGKLKNGVPAKHRLVEK